MTKEERTILVAREIERAKHYLAQSDEMISPGHWDIAANRKYYACFHAVQALFVNRGISGNTHKGMISQFSMNFVKTNEIATSYGSFLSRMMQLRQKADYNCFYDIGEEDVRTLSKPTHEFVNVVLSKINK